MASADELLREAQYAFRNISHGSTAEGKYKAQAEKYAKQLLRKYPASVEASQARQILAQLNVEIPLQLRPAEPQRDAAAEFEKSHSRESGHTTELSRQPAPLDAALQQSGMTEDWRDLIRRLMRLPSGKKKMIAFVIFFLMVFFFPFGFFIVSGLIIYYALNTALLKKHLDLLLTRLESN